MDSLDPVLDSAVGEEGGGSGNLPIALNLTLQGKSHEDGSMTLGHQALTFRSVFLGPYVAAVLLGSDYVLLRSMKPATVGISGIFLRNQVLGALNEPFGVCRDVTGATSITITESVVAWSSRDRFGEPVTFYLDADLVRRQLQWLMGGPPSKGSNSR